MFSLLGGFWCLTAAALGKLSGPASQRLETSGVSFLHDPAPYLISLSLINLVSIDLQNGESIEGTGRFNGSYLVGCAQLAGENAERNDCPNVIKEYQCSFQVMYQVDYFTGYSRPNINQIFQLLP